MPILFPEHPASVPELQELAKALAQSEYENWRKIQESNGWKAGETYDEVAKTDPDLRGFDALSEESSKTYQKLESSTNELLKKLSGEGYFVRRRSSWEKFCVIYSSEDAGIVNEVIRELEANRLETVSCLDVGGELDEKLRQADVLLVAVSSRSVGDETVNQQIRHAVGLYGNKSDDKIVPIVIDDGVLDVWKDQKQLYDCLNSNNRTREANNVANYYLFYLLANCRRCVAVRTRLDENGAPRLDFSELLMTFKVKEVKKISYGSLRFPLHIYVGGDGTTRYENREDVEASVDDHCFELPPQIPQSFYDDYIKQKIQENEKNGRIFHNGDQLRFKRATWGTPENGIDRGDENKPLKLSLEFTNYFLTTITNFAVYGRDGRGVFITRNDGSRAKIEDLLSTKIDDPGEESRYSDPFTTNLSVITKDGYIFCKTRGGYVASNHGAIQPAVSGSGAWKDVKVIENDSNGKRIFSYSPFDTAIREAREEIIGDALHKDRFKVVFFGLARISRTRFPFLFGELRCDYTKDNIMRIHTECQWEGEPIPIEFTIDAVTNWIKKQYETNPSSQYATTYFSLIQSLIYEYPDKIEEINQKLTF